MGNKVALICKDWMHWRNQTSGALQELYAFEVWAFPMGPKAWSGLMASCLPEILGRNIVLGTNFCYIPTSLSKKLLPYRSGISETFSTRFREETYI